MNMRFLLIYFYSFHSTHPWLFRNRMIMIDKKEVKTVHISKGPLPVEFANNKFPHVLCAKAQYVTTLQTKNY